jgi:3-oxoacyl-[acyl-carrier-protein] synthase I
MRLSLVASGLVTPVGFSAPASLAAIRASFDGFIETRFQCEGAWLVGAPVQLADTLQTKDTRLAASVIDECLEALPPHGLRDVALALCVAEVGRPGRAPWLGETFHADVRAAVEHAHRLGPENALFERGAVGAVEALEWASTLLGRKRARYVIVAGVDSYLHHATLEAYHAAKRLVTRSNADGFLPGECAAAIAISAEPPSEGSLACVGIGWGREPSATDAAAPHVADGLTAAYRDALAKAALGFESIDYRITDASGEQRAAKEAALVLTRVMRTRKAALPMWQPAECVGHIGAAMVPLMLALALDASREGYAPGPGVLCHVTDEAGLRAALVLRELDRVGRSS